MEKIKELIEIEKEYIEERVNGIDNINFAQILEDNGFTPDEFQYIKAEYYLETFNPVVLIGEVKVIDGENFEVDRARAKKNSMIFALPTKKTVWYSQDDSFNKEYCDINNILYKKRGYLGGVICSLPTDLDVSIIAGDAPVQFPIVVLDKVQAWIKSKTSEEVEIKGNDILVNGNKVVGMANYTYGTMTLCGFHVSFDLDMDFIRGVCKKEIKKVPESLKHFGDFDREELITEMISWLK